MYSTFHHGAADDSPTASYTTAREHINRLIRPPIIQYYHTPQKRFLDETSTKTLTLPETSEMIDLS